MYMSPEQARGEVLDHRSDLFSLGSVLYTLGTGRPPFRASNTMAVLKRVCEDAHHRRAQPAALRGEPCLPPSVRSIPLDRSG
jgi:serine/threonine protein kinase